MSTERSRTLNRRSFAKALVTGTGLVTALTSTPANAAPAIRDRFGARFIEHGELTLALLNTDQAAIQPLLDDYEKLSGTRINTVVDSYNDIYTKISISLTQSTGAFDIVSLDDPWIPQFTSREFLIDLSERMDKDGEKLDNDHLPVLTKLGEFPTESGLRAVPWTGSAQLLAWRNDLLGDFSTPASTTWDDLLALAARITSEQSANGTYGFGLRGRTGNPAATTFLPVLRGFGKDLLDPKTNEPQLASRQAIKAMTMLMDLNHQAPSGAEKTGHAENGANFISGAIAISADIWPDQLIRAYRSSVVDFGFGLEPGQDGVAPTNVTGSWLFGVASGSKNAERAAEFLYWFSAAKQQKRLLLECGVPPTRASVFTNSEVVEQLPFMPAVLDSIRRSRPRQRTPYYRALEEICGKFVSEAIAGRISAEDAMTGANEEIRTLLVREGVLPES